MMIVLAKNNAAMISGADEPSAQPRRPFPPPRGQPEEQSADVRSNGEAEVGGRAGSVVAAIEASTAAN